MSHTSVKHSSSTSSLTTSLEDLVGLGFKLILISLDNFRTLVQQVPTSLPQMPDLTSLRPKDPCCCHIPETECPPHCVCDVTWEATPGNPVCWYRCVARDHQPGALKSLVGGRTLRHRRRDVHRAECSRRRRLPRGDRRQRRVRAIHLHHAEGSVQEDVR
jgi:hypothetical protein